MSVEDWVEHTAKGCLLALQGDYSDALQYWGKADEIASANGSEWGVVKHNPELCMLRFKLGEAEGIVRAPIPTEDLAVSMYFSDDIEESDSSRGMVLAHTDPTPECFRHYEFDYQLAGNIKKELPHLMVMSTGRCGTISLARLLNKAQYLTYHSCLLNTSIAVRSQMVAQMISGNHESDQPEQHWAMTRAAEWLGAINEDRPLALCGHFDTVFAPTLAAIHPLSKFIYLHRDPVKIFESFYTKRQWNPIQLNPIWYKFPFQWCREQMDLPYLLAWYIKFTENYCRSFGEVMGDRFYEISADQLFDLDPFEVELLYEFTGMDLNFAEVQGHFETPHNEKIHKRDDTNLEAGREAFLEAYDSL